MSFFNDEMFFFNHRIPRGFRIKELKSKKNLTQLDLAKMINVRREIIVFLKKGKYNPSLKLAYDISKIFHLPI